MIVQMKFFTAALLAALLLVTVDITGRLWSPLQAADNTWQPVQLPVFVQPTAPAPALLQFFQVKAEAESAQDVPTTNLQRAADEQQIGDYRVSLFGIYSKAGVYRTVLSVEAKAQSAKPATYTLGEIAPGLTITHIDAKTVRLSAAGSQITLQLFNTQRSTAAQHQ